MIHATQNKVAMVTGAAGALGSELSLQLALTGWEVVLIDHKRRVLEQLYDRIVAQGGVKPVIHVVNLVTLDPQQCQEIVAALETGPGRLDALIHCAASFEGLRPSQHIEPQVWLKQIQVNLNAPWLLSISSLELLRRAPSASLVFLSENLETVTSAYWGAYGVSKHGIQALAAQLSSELSDSKIQVLAVNPGPMQSNLRSRVFYSENPAQLRSAAKVARIMIEILEGKRSADSFKVDLSEPDRLPRQP